MVIHLKLAKASAINPPVKLQIEILPEDVGRANRRNFKVAYWRQAARKWVILKDDIPCATGDVDVGFDKVSDPIGVVH